MDCRIVFCPSGQLRDGNGKCRYPNKFWYNQAYVMYTEFASEETIDMSEGLQKSGILSDLKSPWQNDWSIKGIFLEDTVQLKNISHFIVFLLKREKLKVNPRTFFINIKKMMDGNWLLRKNNKTINMMSSFFKYSFTVFNRNKVSIVDFGNHSKTYSLPFYKSLKYFGVYENNMHILTKLYFCDQIELVQSDFTLSEDNRILYNFVTKKYLFKGEFALMTNNSFEGLQVRVCLEDSGFYRTFSVGSQISKTYLVVSAFAVLLL